MDQPVWMFSTAVPVEDRWQTAIYINYVY